MIKNTETGKQENLKQDSLTDKNQDMSELAKEVLKKAEYWIDKLEHQFDIQPQSLEELMLAISPSVDDHVKKTSVAESLTPLGGEIVVSLNQNRDIYMVMKNYYENASKQIILKETTKTLPKEALDQPSYSRLEVGHIVFPIDPPAV